MTEARDHPVISITFGSCSVWRWSGRKTDPYRCVFTGSLKDCEAKYAETVLAMRRGTVRMDGPDFETIKQVSASDRSETAQAQREAE